MVRKRKKNLLCPTQKWSGVVIMSARFRPKKKKKFQSKRSLPGKLINMFRYNNVNQLGKKTTKNTAKYKSDASSRDISKSLGLATSDYVFFK